jgi:hypothetical protein
MREKEICSSFLLRLLALLLLFLAVSTHRQRLLWVQKAEPSRRRYHHLLQQKGQRL